MRRSTFRQRVTAWIATLAMLAAALVPAISQAAYQLSGERLWLEICTAYGIQRVAAAVDPDDGSDGARLLAEHCTYCSLYGGLVGPPQSATLPTAPQVEHVIVGRTLHDPRPPLAWAASRPRAPPPAH